MSFKQRTIHKTNNNVILNPNKAQVILIQGARGSGKSTTDEKFGELLYNEGHTVLDILSAPNLENCYWAVCKDCKKEWESMDKNARKELHCKCHNRHKILLVVPEYVEFDDYKLGLYNGKYYSKKEWASMGYVEWINGDPNHIKKERGTEWIKVIKLPVPKARDANKEQIIEKFRQCLLTARSERRILVMNPAFYKITFHWHKTLEVVIKNLGKIAIESFKPLTEKDLKKPKTQFTKFEKNYHRMAVCMREFGSVAPSQLKVDQYETLAKKALLGFIRLCRHYNISLIGDYQRQADVFSGIKDQRDIFIFKRSNRDLIPDDWKWLQDYLDSKRQKIIDKYGNNPRAWGLADLKFPKIEDLSNEYCYVVFANNHVKLMKIPMPTFHHKREIDNFENDTGVRWKFIGEDMNATLDMPTGEKEVAVDDKNEKVLYDLIDGMLNPIGKKGMKIDECFAEIMRMEDSGRVATGWKGKKPNAMRMWFSRRKKKEQDKKK